MNRMAPLGGAIETALAALRCELLASERVSRHASFFAHDAHSLFAVRLINRLADYGLAGTLRDLFLLGRSKAMIKQFGRIASMSRKCMYPSCLSPPLVWTAIGF
jgi:hypothetical protein